MNSAFIAFVLTASSIGAPFNPATAQMPNARQSITSTQQSASTTEAAVGTHVNCPPSMSSIPVFGRAKDLEAPVARLRCDERVAVLGKDSGRIGLDNILTADGTMGLVQDSYLAGSTPPGFATAPTPTHHDNPPYSDKARRDKVQGEIILTVAIDAHGKVTDVQELSKPLGDGLDKSAIKTVKTWKFKPATWDGNPLATRTIVELTFRLF